MSPFLRSLVSSAAVVLLAGGLAVAQDGVRDRGARYEAGRADAARESARPTPRPQADRGPADFHRPDGRLRNRTDDNRHFTPSPRDEVRAPQPVQPNFRYVPDRAPRHDGWHDTRHVGRQDPWFDRGFHQPAVRTPVYTRPPRSSVSVGVGVSTGPRFVQPLYHDPFFAPTYVRPDFYYVGPWDYGWSAWYPPAHPSRAVAFRYSTGSHWYGPWAPSIYSTTVFSRTVTTYSPGGTTIRYEEGVYHNWPGHTTPVRLRPLRHYGAPATGSNVSFQVRYNYAR